MMKILSRWLRNIMIFFFTSTILSVVILKYIPVYITPLMLIRAAEAVIDGNPPVIAHHWVPLEHISHNLPQAVMASEDNLFLKHSGFDLEQNISVSVRRNVDFPEIKFTGTVKP